MISRDNEDRRIREENSNIITIERMDIIIQPIRMHTIITIYTTD
jgi:hypothetical protein